MVVTRGTLESIRGKWVLESGRGRGRGRGLRCVMQQAAVLTLIFDAEVPWNDYLLLHAFAGFVHLPRARKTILQLSLSLTCTSSFILQARGLPSSAEVIIKLLKHLQKQ